MADLEVHAERADESPGTKLLAEHYAEVKARYPGWSAEKGATASPDGDKAEGGLSRRVIAGERPVRVA